MANEIMLEEYPKYLIYPDGRVYSMHRNKFLKQSKKKTGYLAVSILNSKKEEKTMSVHRLVAIAYVPNPDNKPQVNHKDGDKTNNNYLNLEWVTASENQKHAYKNNLNTFSEIDRINLKIIQENRKRPVFKIDKNTNRILCGYNSIKEAGAQNHIDYKLIHAVCKGKQKTTYGHKWAYKEDVINGWN